MTIGSVGGSGMPPNLDATVVQEKYGGRDTFEILTQLALPLTLGAIAYFRTDVWWFWALVVVAFVPVALSLYPTIKKKLGKWMAVWQDRRLVQKMMPSFKRHVERFGRFVGANNAHQLSKVVESELRRNGVTNPKELGMLNEIVIQGFWEKLRKRIQADNLGFTTGVRSVEEFNYILRTYLTETVEPVFDQMPPGVRESLPDQAKRELGAFRESLMHFVNSYNTFATELAENLSTYHLQAPSFGPPKPHV